ncbi:MAG: DNA-protecting protein DprA [Candidatus Microsaccharimonas sossegonensis]|uniref:DNA-protecting protein DprA n=1 Tax=Candidatus Microsaccharimonas sossegonensis TaxID=2506948 RepID=A0A4Q0AHN0_9BACT|nr:MAG: DNA-protecting protein DprA [Candidatus Microsaccharimonas sossegonensis]
MKINVISPDDHIFFRIISTIAKKPKALYFIGTLPHEGSPVVAIVGSRKPTSYGKEVTFNLAYKLAQKGVIIVSGLAIGIDTIAHQAALKAGGTTIAVLAGGLDTIYPATNQKLAVAIVKNGGALISEYPPGTLARDFQFLARNRIVSGVSDAIIVAEAASRSGTLSTVAHALEQNREVFAVPGNITSPMSVGPNRLISQGAHPVTCVDDILQVIAPHLLEPQTTFNLGSNAIEIKIIELLKSGIRDGDALQKASGFSASEFLQSITMLEIQGIIRALGGNRWTII